MPGEIWTPGEGVVPLQPKTFKADIGGLELDVLEKAPPAEMRVPMLSGEQLMQLTCSVQLQVMAVLRELVSLQKRLAALEGDTTPAPAAAGSMPDDDELTSCSG